MQPAPTPRSRLSTIRRNSINKIESLFKSVIHREHEERAAIPEDEEESTTNSHRQQPSDPKQTRRSVIFSKFKHINDFIGDDSNSSSRTLRASDLERPVAVETVSKLAESAIPTPAARSSVTRGQLKEWRNSRGKESITPTEGARNVPTKEELEVEHLRMTLKITQQKLERCMRENESLRQQVAQLTGKSPNQSTEIPITATTPVAANHSKMPNQAAHMSLWEIVDDNYEAKPRRRPPGMLRRSSSLEVVLTKAKSIVTPQPSPTPNYSDYIKSLPDAPPSLPLIETNVTVAVRVRPLRKEEFEAGVKDVISTVGGSKVLVSVPTKRYDYLREGRNADKTYDFERAFSGVNATQEFVYENTAKSLIRDVIVDGTNCTLFAYGATGSGKTHTMFGDKVTPGIVTLALRDIFQILDNDMLLAAVVTVSFLEVYNEKIRDLMVADPDAVGDLVVQEDKDGVQVVGLSSLEVKSSEEILQILSDGDERRTKRATKANATSSRSHALFRITIARHFKTGVRTSSLTLVDLAGSERTKSVDTKGAEAETININKSLLTLGDCIQSLAQGKSHVPYRDSKLTRLLKSCLSGESRTVMIAALSPAELTVDESINTLKYASRARSIKTLAAQKRSAE